MQYIFKSLMLIVKLLLTPWRRLRSALVLTKEPHVYLSGVASPGNYWAQISRTLGVEGTFRRQYLRAAFQYMTEEYRKKGVNLEVRTQRSGNFSVYCTAMPKPLTRYFVHKAVSRRLVEFAHQRLSELTGKTTKQINSLYALVAFTIPLWAKFAKVKVTNKALGRVGMIWSEYIPISRVDMALVSILLIGSDCTYCDFDPNKHKRYYKVAEVIGSGCWNILHRLLCREEKLRRIEALFSSTENVEKMTFGSEKPIGFKASLALRINYSIEDLEELSLLLSEKVISRRFLLTALSYCLVVRPQEWLVLKRLVEKENLDWWVISSCYHRGVPLENTPGVFQFVESGLLSFYEARQAFEFGVLPEIADLLTKQIKWRAQDVITLHRLVQTHGFDEVKIVFGYYQGELRRVTAFWGWQKLYPDLSFEELFQKIDAGTVESFVPERVRPISRKRRRETQVAQVSQLEVISLASVNEDPLQATRYRNVRAGDLPNINGNRMFRLFQQCGWVKVGQSGDHVTLEKNGMKMPFVHSRAKRCSRYTLFYAFQRVGIPESEVQLLIDTWNGVKRQKLAS